MQRRQQAESTGDPVQRPLREQDAMTGVVADDEQQADLEPVQHAQ
jgi:hypothetical protein